MFLRYIIHHDEIFKICAIAKRSDVNDNEISNIDVDTENHISTSNIASHCPILLIHPAFFRVSLFSLCYVLLCFLPLASVDDGVHMNWFMIYVTSPIASFLGIASFVYSFEFVVEDLVIPLRTKMISIIIGSLSISFSHVILTDPRIGLNLFPFPFFPFTLGSIGLLPTSFVIYLSIRRHRDMTKRLVPAFHVISVFVFTVLIALCWACIFRYLEPYSFSQTLWSLFYIPCKYVSKFVLFAPVLTHTIPHRWLTTVLIVEIFFTRFQAAVVPFASSYWSLCALLIESAFSPAWKYYGGSDRLVLLWHYLVGYCSKYPSERRDSEISAKVRSSFVDSAGEYSCSLILF